MVKSSKGGTSVGIGLPTQPNRRSQRRLQHMCRDVETEMENYVWSRQRMGKKDNYYIPLQPPAILHDANMCFITAWACFPLAASPLPLECYLFHNHAHDDDGPFLYHGSPVIRRNRELAVLG